MENDSIQTIKIQEMKEEIISDYENKLAQYEDITTMLWYILEDNSLARINDNNKKIELYYKANFYDRMQTYLFNLHQLLYDRQEEMKNNIEKYYSIREKEQNIKIDS